MLHCIFDMAAEDYDIPSPMKKVVLPAYQTKKGEALTKDEETRLVNYCKSHREVEGTDALLVLLYFGPVSYTHLDVYKRQDHSYPN